MLRWMGGRRREAKVIPVVQIESTRANGGTPFSVFEFERYFSGSSTYHILLFLIILINRGDDVSSSWNARSSQIPYSLSWLIFVPLVVGGTIHPSYGPNHMGQGSRSASRREGKVTEHEQAITALPCRLLLLLLYLIYNSLEFSTPIHQFTFLASFSLSMESRENVAGTEFEDLLPVMASKLGGDGLIRELCNGFRLLMDKEEKVITFESLKKNSALLGLQDLGDEELMSMIREGDLDGDGALSQMEFCVLMFRLSPELMEESEIWLDEALHQEEMEQAPAGLHPTNY